MCNIVFSIIKILVMILNRFRFKFIFGNILVNQFLYWPFHREIHVIISNNKK